MPLPPNVISSGSKVQFVFSRSGGAIVHARLSIWQDPGEPTQKRNDVLFFEDSLDESETITRTLPEGVYSCVLLVFIREDLNGTYRYEHLVNGEDGGHDQGDVNVSNETGEGRANRHEYGLVVS